MMRKSAVLRRALLLLGLLVLTALNFAGAAVRAVEHHKLQREVASLSTTHDEQQSDYDNSRAELERLQTDQDAQTRLIKERLRYARRNEIPIVVTIETPLD